MAGFGQLARGGLMGRLRARMAGGGAASPSDDNAKAKAMGNQMGGQVKDAFAQANGRFDGGAQMGAQASDQARQVRNQKLADHFSGQFRDAWNQANAGQAHAEPDADQAGGPSDNDADDRVRPAGMSRMRSRRIQSSDVGGVGLSDREFQNSMRLR